MNESTHDEVKNPKHYDLGNGVQTIDFIKASLTPDQWEGYLKGSVLKYMSRAGKKSVSTRDYEKAAWYLEKLGVASQNKSDRPRTETPRFMGL